MIREKSGHLPGLGLQRRALRRRRPWAWPPVERCIETQLSPASRSKRLISPAIAQAEFPTRILVYFGTYKIRQGDKDAGDRVIRLTVSLVSPCLPVSLSVLVSVSANYPA